MGQPVRVVEKPSVAQPGTFRYETNRPLTGMGHELYRSADDATDPESTSDEIARRLFARGGIDRVHVYGSVVTVDVAKGADADGITELIESLFTYYTEDSVDSSPSAASEPGAPDDDADGASSPDTD